MHTHELWKAQLLDREPKVKSTRASRKHDYIIGALFGSGIGCLLTAFFRMMGWMCLALIMSSICWGSELPESPSTLFKTATVFQIGGLIADGITTARIPGQHWNGDPGNQCVEKWSPMLYGRMPSAGRVAGVMAAEFAATQTLAHMARRGLFGTWVAKHDYLFPAANAASHWTGAVNNFRSACR